MFKRETKNEPQRGSTITGVVELTAKGAAYIISDESEGDIFVAFANLKHALNGDKVKIAVYARSRSNRLEGEVVEILERKKATFVGTVNSTKNYAFLAPGGRQMPYDIFLPARMLHGAKNGDKVVVSILEWPDDQKSPIGSVVQVLGTPGDNDTEMNAIMAEFELPVEFPTKVLQAAEKVDLQIPASELKKRLDFRGTTTFTIDPKDAKDFDDALSIKLLEDGLYEVGIHIADVSYYVEPETTLDKEAYSRGTSVYLADRTIPMLPERLSNGVCSLRPNEDKLCFSAVFKLNDQAEVKHEWFGRTIIRSNRRFTYEEAQEIIEGADGELKKEILLMNDLAQKLRAQRFQKGAMDFERMEVKFELDEKGKPISVYCKESKESNKLVEEFMLLANKKVAEKVGNAKGMLGTKAKTFIYRIHDKPTQKKLEDFNHFITKFGYSIRLNSQKALKDSMNNLMEALRGKPEQNMIEVLAIRTMAKAVYSTDNIGHYGLAFEHYSHFTSPIRRYPDIMVHRLLQRYMDGGRSVSQEKYEEMCKHTSAMEQLAANAERASIKYKQVEYMVNKVGQDFSGTISGVTQWGFYVELDESKSEGLVSIRALEDDDYEFDERNYRIIGNHRHKVYQLGDTVTVTVAQASLEARQLDFILAGTENHRVNKHGKLIDSHGKEYSNKQFKRKKQAQGKTRKR
ncbi:ribonuclease R [Bacteroidia bacterium]|nr:ribonuclease R [Bacteroidia bacterium]